MPPPPTCVQPFRSIRARAPCLSTPGRAHLAARSSQQGKATGNHTHRARARQQVTTLTAPEQGNT
eukprot:2301514-Pyramimonas_sp.AAC.1